MTRGIERITSPEPPCRLVRFEATDGVELAGLLYEPRRPSGRAIAFLHGNGGASIFDSKRTNRLAEPFLEAGFAWFPFNNRGAHLIRRLKSSRRRRSVPGGMAHELIRDAVHDIDGAIDELRRRGYRDITLIGHSSGANKAVVYDRRAKSKRAARYVLLAGGDDSGLTYASLGAARFRKALERARAMTRAKRGEELVPASISSVPLSWRSFLDLSNPDGEYNVFPFLEALRGERLSRRPPFHALAGIRKRTLVLYGSEDPYCHGDVEGCVGVMAEALQGRRNFEFAILDGADHGFSGYEPELARAIVEWIRAR